MLSSARSGFLREISGIRFRLIVDGDSVEISRQLSISKDISGILELLCQQRKNKVVSRAKESRNTVDKVNKVSLCLCFVSQCLPEKKGLDYRHYVLEDGSGTKVSLYTRGEVAVLKKGSTLFIKSPKLLVDKKGNTHLGIKSSSQVQVIGIWSPLQQNIERTGSGYTRAIPNAVLVEQERVAALLKRKHIHLEGIGLMSKNNAPDISAAGINERGRYWHENYEDMRVRKRRKGAGSECDGVKEDRRSSILNHVIEDVRSAALPTLNLPRP